MKKEDVLRAYEEQKAACIVAFPTLTSSWTYFVQLEKAIDSYFSNVDSVSDAVRAVIRGAYVSQTKAALKCKDDEKLLSSGSHGILNDLTYRFTVMSDRCE